jgi:L-alanine-DL-glutamate epimerase-like enolase superfamily enzyme
MSTSGKPRIRSEKIKLELEHAWVIARGAAEFKENVLVHYERDGLTGVGEAGHLTAAGQTAEQTLAGAEKLMNFYESLEPSAYASLPDQASAVPDVTPPARAAMEMALLDWVGKKRGMPLHQLLGVKSHREVFTSYSIGLDAPEVMRQKAREAGAYRILKVKLGRENDEEIIRTLRAVTDKPIRVDANEGWRDKETAIRKLEWLERHGIELVEQPLPRQLVEENRWLKERTRLPLIADEAVHTTRDIPVIAGAYSGINIKIMKAGGVLEALRMFSMAEKMGLDAMLGCMIETSVAITAAVHLQSLARWVDLDGNLLLKRDPYQGAKFSAGRWLVPNSPGLGVEPRT